IDFSKIKIWAGNYDFWKQSSELAIQLRANQNKRVEEKAKDLEAFIRRFSANASKSKQATSRRKHLEKLTLDDIPSSSRKTPHCIFNQEREAGDILLQVSNLSKTINGQKILQDVSFEILRGEKVIFVGKDEVAMTLFFELLMGEVEPDEGTVKWGVTTRRSYLPKDNSNYFEGKKDNLIDWLREFSEDKSENFIRGFLGKMLFSGEETKKSVSVLSGGEKVRCMLSRMMLQEANVLLLDGPTNHLDLESIIALNTGLIDFKGTVLFSTHDHDFAQSLSKRLIEITDTGLIDHQIDYEDYISN
ncbi:MAG: ABC transporter ATP-binding protein, partial [Zetaproteobacteria bacterium]|nr:ABC transporter ATP-binding protein [Pseudobdellovibrionaceae bacterium]